MNSKVYKIEIELKLSNNDGCVNCNGPAEQWRWRLSFFDEKGQFAAASACEECLMMVISNNTNRSIIKEIIYRAEETKL